MTGVQTCALPISRNFGIIGTGILRNPLAIVGAVDIHLAATIGTYSLSSQNVNLYSTSYASPYSVLTVFSSDESLVHTFQLHLMLNSILSKLKHPDIQKFKL